MCGRYTIAHSSDDILERFEAIIAEATDTASTISSASVADAPPPGDVLRANFNVAPTVSVPVILRPDVETDPEAPRVLQTARWGLLPFWVKDIKKAKPLINARAETLVESKTFKRPFVRKRCIIPAESFYEWQKTGAKKIPMRILLKGHSLYGFAGIWDEWQSPEGEVIKSCSIITVAANELVQPVHDRMPAILPPHLEAAWLDNSKFDLEVLNQALTPYPSEKMEMYPVSDFVNSVRNNSPRCAERADDVGHEATFMAGEKK